MRRRKSPDSAPWMIRWSYVEVSVMILLTARSASVSGFIPWNSAGYSMAPTPMIAPWPAVSRGTEGVVAMLPGVGQADGGALEVLEGELVGAGSPDDVLVGPPELGEVHLPAALDRGHHER